MIRSLFDVENIPEGEEKSEKTKKADETLERVNEIVIDSEVEVAPKEVKPVEVREVSADEIIQRVEPLEVPNERIGADQKPVEIFKTLPADEILSIASHREVKETQPEEMGEINNFETQPVKTESVEEIRSQIEHFESEAKPQAEIEPKKTVEVKDEFDPADYFKAQDEAEFKSVQKSDTPKKEIETKLESETNIAFESPIVADVRMEAKGGNFLGLADDEPKIRPILIEEKEDKQDEIVQMDFKPESKAETIRKSGLAWTAATVLFASVGFLLILGWFVDLLLGSSPWGIVVGIVIGSIIGFYNFFRLTSQILKDSKN